MSINPDNKLFLESIKKHTRPGEMPERWHSTRHFEDPVARFSNAQEKVQGRVIHTMALNEAFVKLQSVLRTLEVEHVVMNAEPPLEALNEADFTSVKFHRLENHKHEPDKWRALCAAAGAGITSAEALLAETGTVICSSGPGKSRAVSLLPPVHIVICPQSRFTTDIFTWLDRHNGIWPANTFLISGPSKTADIEQTMSVGIHGPKKLIVILYNDLLNTSL